MNTTDHRDTPARPDTTATPEPPTLPAAEIDRLADEIAGLAIAADATAHRLLTAIRRFDQCRGWATHGAQSCAHWLGWRIGLERGAAREHVRVAKALGSLPRIDAALARGLVSYSKIRAITRVATPETESTLLNYAQSSTAWQLERICRSFRRCVTPSEELDRERRWVRSRDAADGMVRIEAQLRADEAAMMLRAIEAVRERCWRERDATERRSDDPASRADALVRLVEEALAAEVERASDPRGVPVELVVHLGASGSATLDDGSGVPAGTLERLVCDTTVTQVAAPAATEPDPQPQPHADPTIRRTRTLPARLRRALWLRDGRCRFPGCANRLTDGHHITPWSHGGPTTLGNLVSLCRRHHKAVHEQGFRLTLETDGTLRVNRADGAPVPPMEGPAEVTAAPAAELPDLTDLAHPHETIPHWDGSRVDYAAAVDALWWRARGVGLAPETGYDHIKKHAGAE